MEGGGNAPAQAVSDAFSFLLAIPLTVSALRQMGRK
jgi:hypothetical protein